MGNFLVWSAPEFIVFVKALTVAAAVCSALSGSIIFRPVTWFVAPSGRMYRKIESQIPIVPLMLASSQAVAVPETSTSPACRRQSGKVDGAGRRLRCRQRMAVSADHIAVGSS